MKKLKRPLNNEGGVALLITLFAIMIMIFMAVEISYNTHVELKVGSSQLDQLKAYYLAKSGVELSLLRINVYKNVVQRFGSQLGSSRGDLDLIWQFPFSWPPLLPDTVSDFDKDNIQKSIKKSYIDGAFSTSIEGESGKLNLNDLGSPAQTLRQATYTQLFQLIQNRLQADDDWAHAHQDLQAQDVVNAIANWVTPGPTGPNGDSKSAECQGEDPQVCPTGMPFKTIDELHMVKGVTDDIYDLIAPISTVYGVEGININYCPADLIRSIDPRITPEMAQAAVARRQDPNQGGPFQNAQDFTNFLQSQGMNVQNFNTNPPIPLLFDAEYNFKIKSTGVYGNAQREIVAIVVDFDKVKGQLASQLASASPSPGMGTNPMVSPSPPPGASASPGPSGAVPTAANGPPQIVFWQEY